MQPADGRVDPGPAGKTLQKLNEPVPVLFPSAPAAPAPSPFTLFPHISSPYGWRAHDITKIHAGLDFPLSVGTTLGSLVEGQARLKHAAGKGWGWYVELLVGGQIAWRYAHLDETKTKPLFASVGQDTLRDVKKGELIAYSGISGTSAAHLHLELLEGGQRVSPLTCFPYTGREPEKPKLASGATLHSASATTVKMKLSVKAPDWDLAAITIKLVQLNGTNLPSTEKWEMKVDGQAPDRLVHAGDAVWNVERELPNLPQAVSAIENLWTFEVIARTWKSKTNSERFTYKWSK